MPNITSIICFSLLYFSVGAAMAADVLASAQQKATTTHAAITRHIVQYIKVTAIRGETRDGQTVTLFQHGDGALLPVDDTVIALEQSGYQHLVFQYRDSRWVYGEGGWRHLTANRTTNEENRATPAAYQTGADALASAQMVSQLF